MTSNEINECLDVALDAVLSAAPIALEYFRKPMQVDDKLPGIVYDPVTEADKRIETAIRDRLTEAFPTHGIVGEEHGATGSRETYWVIDPIDGTRAFISGMPTWGMLLGLVTEGRAVAGIMHQPFTGETFVGGPDSARFLHQGAESPLKASACAGLDDAILYSTHPMMFYEPEMAARYERLTNRCRLQRWGGDCYGFALVAMGSIDLMVDALLMPYDIVPLIPIIEGAGGVVTNLEGHSPLDGGTVIAAANATLHAEALELMNTPAGVA